MDSNSLLDRVNSIIIRGMNFYKKYNSFYEIPIITKKDLIKSQAIFPPFGEFTDSSHNIEQIYRTSGTSDKPLLLCFTKKDINLITDIGCECFKYSGMGALGNEEIVINCLNLSMWAGGFFDSQAMMKTGVQVINYGTGNTNELIHLILKLNKKYKVSLHCTPSYLPVISRLLNDEFKLSASDLLLNALYLGAEGGVQNNEFRNKLISEWNCNVYNANYGMSEVCSIMASANDKNILKFSKLFLENYYVELLNKQGEAVSLRSSKEGDEGELIITSLKKEAQPLLRYNSREIISIKENKNAEIYFEITGRSDDMLVYKGVNFYPEQVRSIVNQYDFLTGIFKIKVLKREDIIKEVLLICETKREYKLSRMKLELEKKIKQNCNIKVSVSFIDKINIPGNKIKIVEIENI